MECSVTQVGVSEFCETLTGGFTRKLARGQTPTVKGVELQKNQENNNTIIITITTIISNGNGPADSRDLFFIAFVVAFVIAFVMAHAITFEIAFVIAFVIVLLIAI